MSIRGGQPYATERATLFEGTFNRSAQLLAIVTSRPEDFLAQKYILHNEIRLLCITEYRIDCPIPIQEGEGMLVP